MDTVLEKAVLFSLLTVAIAGSCTSADGDSHRNNSRVLSIHAPTMELLDGYHSWLISHPRSFTESQPSTKDPKPFLVETPTIDLYSPAGDSLYHVADPGKNATFIANLPNDIRASRKFAPLVNRPTLSEAIAMFPELRKLQLSPADWNGYTAFAIGCEVESRCEAQHQAIQKLMRSTMPKNLRLIEVELTK